MKQLLTSACVALIAAGCGADDTAPQAAATPAPSPTTFAAATPSTRDTITPTPTAVADRPAPSPSPALPPPPNVGPVSCYDDPPEGATLPPPLPRYSGGVCPLMEPGRVVLPSGGKNRELLLAIPSDLDPNHERLPVAVMWHALGASASSMHTHGQAQKTADDLRVIVAMPESAGDLGFRVAGEEIDFEWPYLSYHREARVQEEAVFFDDILACLAEQYPVNESCVSTAGVSAGGLWVSQLLQLRANRLASALVISGGVGPALRNGFVDVKGWQGASRAVPTLVAWGGSNDTCAVNFERASRNLEDRLRQNGSFVMECVHNCGHAAPPVDPIVGLPILWSFAIDHPYWLPAGASPYLSEGMLDGTPDWCALGPGSATVRAGACVRDGEAIPSCPVPEL